MVSKVDNIKNDIWKRKFYMQKYGDNARKNILGLDYCQNPIFDP